MVLLPKAILRVFVNIVSCKPYHRISAQPFGKGEMPQAAHTKCLTTLVATFDLADIHAAVLQNQLFLLVTTAHTALLWGTDSVMLQICTHACRAHFIFHRCAICASR